MKKAFAFLSTVVLTASLLVHPTSGKAATTFSDVSMYKEEIGYLTDQKIINGYPDGTFKPDQPIKRLQAVQMILREMGISDTNAPNPNFKDVKPGDYGYGDIATAVDLGIISGKQDGTFEPWGTLTRAQMAKILVNAYKLRGIYPYDFKDITPDSWAFEYISPLAANNITTGYGDGTFRPNLPLSRAHFSVFMARLLNSDFKPENEMLADSLLEGLFDLKIQDTDIHPSEPIIYVLDSIENQVVALNYETYEMTAVPLNLPAERMTYRNGKIYVTLLKGQHSSYWWAKDQQGAVAIIDANQMKVEKQFNIDLDPFDIAADGKGHIFVTSGSGQHTSMHSYDEATGEKLGEMGLYERSYMQMHPSLNRIYTIDTNVSPRDMDVFQFDENGKFISTYDSPYHGDYNLATDLTISPDGKYIFNSIGNIFRATMLKDSDMSYVGKLDKAYKTIAFDLEYGEFYTSNDREYITAYDYTTFKPKYQLETYGKPAHMFYQDNKLLILSTMELEGSGVQYVGLETIEFETE
ncbi:S-layer homology domain-containing protein [Bacillus songklensis]|uniref:S-layer homology domain-containing protein n=1 Tax=Bacillus songklensis TaxID=1069116 RepID=A0ABV8AW40_9BACI